MNAPPRAWRLPIRTLVNGIHTDGLPVTDRGLQYGDGLFETIAVHDGGPCLFREHLERLSLGAKRLGIHAPPLGLLRDECRRVIGGESRGVLKLILTRGVGGRGYAPPAQSRPNRILFLFPWPEYPPQWWKQGVEVTHCRTPVTESPVLVGLKHLNRLDQVLARAEWRAPAIAEGLMQDGRGRIIGGTMSNLFLVRDRRLYTPRLDTCGIAGTVRSLVLRLADTFGIPVVEGDIAHADLAAADGLFLTNAVIGVWPVRSLGVRKFDLEHLPSGLMAAARQAAWAPDWGEIG